MRENDLNVRLEARMADLDRLNDLVAAFGNDHGLPAKTVFELALVIEEVFTNIVKYGYPSEVDPGATVVNFFMGCEPGEVTLTIEDGGVAFNPIAAPKPDVNLPFEERSIGGLGIHFVLSLMDEVAYERIHGMNRLTMLKRYPENACPAPETIP